MPTLSPLALLAHFPKLTYRRFMKIAENPRLVAQIDVLEIADLMRIGWEEDTARDFVVWRKHVNREKLSTILEKEAIDVIACTDERFPRLLKEINDPPPALFVRGTLPRDTEFLAVVGTRKNTPYGKQVTNDFSAALAERGLCLVSGLALGTDSFVHAACLEHHAPTIAVLGSGVDRASVYPRAHDTLAKNIVDSGGALVSEYPPGFTPTPYSFPARNRIIAGLCRATLVTEAPIDSGALITARAALDYNRDVLAIPHPITSRAGEGTNMLIKQGAHAVLKPSDVLELLNIETEEKPSARRDMSELDSTERALMDLLTNEPTHIDRLGNQSGLPQNTVASALLMLEMKGWIKNNGGQNYVRRR